MKDIHTTRRALLKLAGVSTLTAALVGAARAEGLSSLAATRTAPPLFAGSTPVSVGAAALRVHSLERMSAYYRNAIGLNELRRDATSVTLGTGERELLHLIASPDGLPEAPTQAGLFHIAFLMPSREALARWLAHAAITRIPLTGFADHSVSEAIYLNDPEGNGLEIYSDRPRENWKWSDGVVTMGTHPLDVDAILALAERPDAGRFEAPDGMIVGHMHLRIGNIADGRRFYQEALGLASTRGNRQDALFVSSGGYHHHVAMNIWSSEGAGMRDGSRTGLAWFSLKVNDAANLSAQSQRLIDAGYSPVTTAGGDLEVVDPWGTTIRLMGTA